MWAYDFNQGLLSYNDATQFCASYGLRLPTESEFERLRERMGFGTPSGYSTQVFLEYLVVNYPNSGNNSFWSSTVVDDCGITVFKAENGYTSRGDTRHETYSVVCVSQ